MQVTFGNSNLKGMRECGDKGIMRIKNLLEIVRVRYNEMNSIALALMTWRKCST